jgi:cyclopropane fatty-acyl-phospholipid synthase-like methyltransferase
MNDEDYLRAYFTNSTDPTQDAYWRPTHLDENVTGEPDEFDIIVAEISDEETVLDVGCGYNPFKGRIKQLTAIDKYNPCADILTDMMDFRQESAFYDVIIALGSTNLHSFNLIEQQIEKLVYWCKPGGRIYMRVNPQTEKVTSPKFATYAWAIKDIAYFTRKHSLEIIKPVVLTDSLRYTFTWQKQR